MSTAERTASDADALPSFDLEFAFDDTDDPDEVTIYCPDADRIITNWITADVDTAIQLDRIA